MHINIRLSVVLIFKIDVRYSETFILETLSNQILSNRIE